VFVCAFVRACVCVQLCVSLRVHTRCGTEPPLKSTDCEHAILRDCAQRLTVAATYPVDASVLRSVLVQYQPLTVFCMYPLLEDILRDSSEH
jgi:hypothetical protein